MQTDRYQEFIHQICRDKNRYVAQVNTELKFGRGSDDLNQIYDFLWDEFAHQIIGDRIKIKELMQVHAFDEDFAHFDFYLTFYLNRKYQNKLNHLLHEQE